MRSRAYHTENLDSVRQRRVSIPQTEQHHAGASNFPASRQDQAQTRWSDTEAYLVPAMIIHLPDIPYLTPDLGQVLLELVQDGKVLVEGLRDVWDGGCECGVCPALVLLSLPSRRNSETDQKG